MKQKLSGRNSHLPAVRGALARGFAILIAAAQLLSACGPSSAPLASGATPFAPVAQGIQATPTVDLAAATPLPARPVYSPGELVDYQAQTGDTLPLLALRFNTTVEEIRAANPIIPDSATTMPPGMPMKIPIYYAPFWGTSFRILPDSLFINGPAQVGFDTADFVSKSSGWLNGYIEYAADANRSGAEIVDLVALNFSLSPRLFLALLDYQSGALSRTDPSPSEKLYPLGYRSGARKGLYRQLLWAANILNNYYYQYRAGRLLTFEHEDGREERLDPWQNGATAALQKFFLTLMHKDAWAYAVGPEGLARTYTLLFGDPWQADQPHLPGSLEQPSLLLPFGIGEVWAYTGGPHTGWGSGEPFAALDFAPPQVSQGCNDTDLWATAVADGVVVRSETGIVMLDLDGDGDERTGWNIFYLHLATLGRARVGDRVSTGQPLGHPSCEGGTSTGTHVHIARKYNGEWINAEGLAGGILAFNMEGWVAHNGSSVYKGTLTRLASIVTACTCSNAASFIQTDRRTDP